MMGPPWSESRACDFGQNFFKHSCLTFVTTSTQPTPSKVSNSLYHPLLPTDICSIQNLQHCFSMLLQPIPEVKKCPLLRETVYCKKLTEQLILVVMDHLNKSPSHSADLCHIRWWAGIDISVAISLLPWGIHADWYKENILRPILTLKPFQNDMCKSNSNPRRIFTTSMSRKQFGYQTVMW